MNRIAGRSAIVLLFALVLVAGMVFFVFEFLVKAETWVVTPGSPHVYNAGNLDCGVVTDRDSVLLLDLSGDRRYSKNENIRRAMLHWLGDRYGNVYSPALSTYSAQIIGYDLFDGMYTYGGKREGVISTTLSSKIQTVALEVMGSYKGTVAVYNYKTGELLCSVSTPTYDPDNAPVVEEGNEGALEGTYLNRFTQSAYTPGSIFKIVTLAAALESIPDIQTRTFTCTGTFDIGGGQVTCNEDEVHGKQNLKEAFRNSCNCAFAQVALELGTENLNKFAKQFGVLEPISFDGVVTAKGNISVLNKDDLNLAWSAIGQGDDEVNPCAFLTCVGAIASGGKGVMPYVVQRVSVNGETTHNAATVAGKRIMSATTAKTVLEYMRYNVERKYGDENFPGLTVCAKTGTAEVGGDQKPHAMLAGFVSDAEYPLAFVVCVENAGYGKTVCIPIASKVLAACKAELDG